MQVLVERSALLKATSRAQGVVERRTTIPILQNLLFEAEGAAVSIKATDLDIEIVESLPCEVMRPGAATVSAHMLHEIVRKLPDGAEVSLVSEGDGALTVSAGRSVFALQTQPREDFPAMASREFERSFTAPVATVRRLFDKAKFAISTEETRYYLNGIYLHTPQAGTPTLRAVATDGHRLAQVELPLPDGAQGMPGVIIPRKTVHELHRLIEDSSATVKVSVSAAKVRFEIGTVTLTSKLIDGTFPDYGRVIPQGNDKELKVSNAEFMGAVDRVSTIASERGRAVKLNIQPDKLILSVNSPEGGSATEEIGVEYGASPLEIGFNARYLLDIASQLNGEEACFKLADPGSPTMVNDPSDESALYVLMPMRV